MRKNLMIALFFALATLANGSTTSIIIGGTDANNVFPFSWYSGNGRYQQFYTGLPAGFEITDISFKTLSSFGQSSPYLLDVTLGLSTAAAQGTSFGANLGNDYCVKYNTPFVFSPGVNRDTDGFDLVFHLNSPFTVTSPGQDILLDVMVNRDLNAFAVFAAGYNDGRSSRLYLSSGVGPSYLDGLSLQTKFTGNAVPEPATMGMIGGGLLALGFYRRRR